MKKLMCESCGAPLKIMENNKTAKCEYCGAEYLLEECIKKNHEIKIDETTKEIYDIAKVSKLVISIITIITILIISAITFGITVGISKQKVSIFNFYLKSMSGIQSGFFVKSDLNKVIESNQKNEKHLITVKYENKEASTTSDISEIIKDLNTNNNYLIELEHDKDGYINVVSIKK